MCLRVLCDALVCCFTSGRALYAASERALVRASKVTQLYTFI